MQVVLCVCGKERSLGEFCLVRFAGKFGLLDFGFDEPFAQPPDAEFTIKYLGFFFGKCELLKLKPDPLHFLHSAPSSQRLILISFSSSLPPSVPSGLMKSALL